MAARSTTKNLFVQVLAANRGGTEGEVLKLAKEHLLSPHARDRALGVTLLAFVDPTQTNWEIWCSLLLPDDASYWVRDQAEWALEAFAVERMLPRRDMPSYCDVRGRSVK